MHAITRREGGMAVRRLCVMAMLATALVVIVPTAPTAQPAGADAKRGRELAARVCTTCHVIDRESSGSMRTDIATFPAIADRGVTAEQLAGAIIILHPARPSV